MSGTNLFSKTVCELEQRRIVGFSLECHIVVKDSRSNFRQKNGKKSNNQSQQENQDGGLGDQYS